jgi:hypothetical protein
VRIGFINYGRFPRQPAEIFAGAEGAGLAVDRRGAAGRRQHCRNRPNHLAVEAAFGHKGVLPFREYGEPDWLFTFTRADEAAEWEVTHDPHHP